ncbi:MAG: TonB family protein [Myxococcales bacterium]|nr:TonB family protein [Myxococcales bacterium]
MTRRRESTTFAVAVAMLIASALVHLVLWPLGNRVLELSWESPPLPSAGGVMEVSLIDGDVEEEDAKKPEEKEPILPGKLVSLDRVDDERPPEETDRIAELNSRVEKEVKAPNQRPEIGEAPTKPGDHPDAAQLPPSLLHPRQAAAAKEHPASAATAENPGLADAGDGEESAPTDAAPAEDGQSSSAPGAQGAPPPRPGLRGTPDDMRRLFGRPGTMDDLHDVQEEGSESLISARQFKFSSFFNRVRDAVAQHWNPAILHAARDPDGRIYGTKTRVTRLAIRLHPDGSLQSVRVDRTSDVDFLDEEAIRAVRAAQPFSNPPPGLVDPETGFIDFGFAFIFEIGQSPKIHRYRR